MREILFRGKGIDNGEWIEGNYQHFYLKSGELIIYISDWGKAIEKVIPETVGQYTGLTDKNGVKVFEGDIVKATDKSVIYFVEYKNGAFMLKQKGVDYHIYFNDLPEKYYCLEIIGNIHDNPELLEVVE